MLSAELRDRPVAVRTLAMAVVVAVPARDEAELIVPCLCALDSQSGPRFDHIVILVNNSTDTTAAAARGFRPNAATQLHVLERALPPDQAHAGHARRIAMAAALELAGPSGVLLTTDADGRVDPGWLGANLAALHAGADVVAGWVDLFAADAAAIPKPLQEDDDRECAYDALCDEIHARLDPDPADPMPRHTQHSGASIAVTAQAFVRSGGVPAIASGEDRALIAALRRVDARIRHAPEVHVAVSGRLGGRSDGGMAATIRRRMERPDEFLDDRLEPAQDCARRAQARSALRTAYMQRGPNLSALAEALALPFYKLLSILAEPYFGMAWEKAEATSPRLSRRLVRREDVGHETAMAQALLAELRAQDCLAAAADR